uniref:Interferon gamma n=1 Tax=Dicentrarchus labrax TaxID=13489 RepID=A0A8C4HEJ7_DICLA
MSSSCGSVFLLVLLGVVLASGSPHGSVSRDLTQIHDSIANTLKLKGPEMVNELFSSVVKSINTSCQRKDLQVMNATLDIYTRIFSNILQEHHNQPGAQSLLESLSDTERVNIMEDLRYLQQKMQTLKETLTHVNHKHEDVMRKLSSIQVEDLMVQKKALAEFKEIYQAASVVHKRCT